MNDVASTATASTTEIPETTAQRVREDCRALRRTAARLTLPYLVRRLVMVVIVAAVFLVLANAILDFGAGVSYDRLGPPDAAVVSFLTRINPYLWWALVVVLGLITFFWTKAAWRNGVVRERAVPVPPGEVRALADTLSPAVLDVMRWVWSDHDDPLDVGDLRRTIAEAQAGRIGKMRIAIEQQAILGAKRPI